MNPREAQFYAMSGATNTWKQVTNYDDTVLHQNSRQRILVVIPEMPCLAAKESLSMTPKLTHYQGEKKNFFFISSRSIVFDSLWSHGLYSPWNSLGQNTGVGNISLLQEIFPIQELNPGLPHCGRILYRLSHKGSPRILGWVPIPSTGDFPNTGIQPGPPALQRESLPTKLSGKPKIWHL